MQIDVKAVNTIVLISDLPYELNPSPTLSTML